MTVREAFELLRSRNFWIHRPLRIPSNPPNQLSVAWRCG